MKITLLFHKLFRINEEKSKGSTLIEITVYTFLLLSFLIILSEAFFSILDLGKETESASNIEQDSRFISARLQYDISNADSVTIPVNTGDQSSLLEVIIGGANHTYAPSGTNLLLTDDSGSDQLNSFYTRVSNLSFTRLGNTGGKNIIKVNFTLTGTTEIASGQETQNFQIIAGAR